MRRVAQTAVQSTFSRVSTEGAPTGESGLYLYGAKSEQPQRQVCY